MMTATPKKMLNKWFTNWTAEDFSHNWDSELYTFKSGESRMFPENMADFFAKHLIDRELNKMGKLTDDQIRISLVEKCFVDPSSSLTPSLQEPASTTMAAVEAMNANAASPQNRRRGRTTPVTPDSSVTPEQPGSTL